MTPSYPTPRTVRRKSTGCPPRPYLHTRLANAFISRSLGRKRDNALSTRSSRSLSRLHIGRPSWSLDRYYKESQFPSAGLTFFVSSPGSMAHSVSVSVAHSVSVLLLTTGRSRGTLFAMCGICVVVCDRVPVDPALIQRMCDRISHRGPDSAGYHVAGRIGLGMRRLRIIAVPRFRW